MISRRTVWIAFFGLILVEIIIGCQAVDLTPGSPVTPRANGYGAHGIVPPLRIPDPPKSSGSSALADKVETPPIRLTEAPHNDTKEISVGTTETTTSAEPSLDLHKLHDAVMDRARHLDSYIARFKRREFVGGKEQPEECITIKYRAEPWSVDMKWLKPDDAAGREVLYVKGRYENKLHILIEKSMPLLGGKKQSFALNDAMVRGRSRHEITEAGIHEFVNRFDTVLTALDRDDKHLGTLVAHGETKRPEFAKPVLLVEHVMPPGYEPLLPQGGRRFLYFDMTEKLPLLVITQDPGGREVEYYCYDCLEANVKLDEADFNPANLAPPKK